LLREQGHAVETLERSSESLRSANGRLTAGAAMLAGGLAPHQVGAAVARTRAQIVHVHNLNPLFGSRALGAARAAGARVVMHLHNYRLFCAIAIAYRDGGLCTRCHGRNTLPGLRLRCRGSFPEAGAYAAGLSLHQPRIIGRVDRFLVPSAAAAARLGDFGMPPEPVTVLPNFLSEDEFTSETRADQGEHALFVGRLTEEKGVETAITAAAQARVPLLVAGSGDASQLERNADSSVVSFAGHLSRADLADARRRAAFAVVPSRSDEVCPYAVIEAMAAGLPVLASGVGGLPEMVGADSTLPPRATGEWAAAMRALWDDRKARQERGEAALSRARELFGGEHFYSGLMRVYESALAGR
jgi:glycosyltransferase involved in cell wall biosynthesis